MREVTGDCVQCLHPVLAFCWVLFLCLRLYDMLQSFMWCTVDISTYHAKWNYTVVRWSFKIHSSSNFLLLQHDYELNKSLNHAVIIVCSKKYIFVPSQSVFQTADRLYCITVVSWSLAFSTPNSLYVISCAFKCRWLIIGITYLRLDRACQQPCYWMLLRMCANRCFSFVKTSGTPLSRLHPLHL